MDYHYAYYKLVHEGFQNNKLPCVVINYYLKRYNYIFHNPAFLPIIRTVNSGWKKYRVVTVTPFITYITALVQSI